MYVACLPHGCDPAAIRRVLAGAPAVDALVLPAGDERDDGKWLIATLSTLRRELFLQPELQVLASVDRAALATVVAEVARMLIEIRSGETLLTRVDGHIDSSSVGGMAAGGEAFLHRSTGSPLPSDAVVESAEVALGAAPFVETSALAAKLVVATPAVRGSLALAATCESLDLQPRDWDLLATVALAARLVEHPSGLGPLWLEVSQGQPPLLIGTSSMTATALRSRIDEEQAALADDSASPDVGIQFGNVDVVEQSPGRFWLAGVVGTPPPRACPLELCYRQAGSQQRHVWPTTISKYDVDWDIVVRSAQEWHRRAEGN